jgi:Protein of unknown function (DUF4231)
MPTQNEQLDFIKKMIMERLADADSSRLFYRQRAYRYYISTIVLGAFTTVLLGLNIETLKETARIGALIITSLVTIINAYNAFFNNKELWVANNSAVNRFYQLNFDISFAEKNPTKISDEEILIFKKRYQEILDELNTTWQKNRLK